MFFGPNGNLTTALKDRIGFDCVMLMLRDAAALISNDIPLRKSIPLKRSIGSNHYASFPTCRKHHTMDGLNITFFHLSCTLSRIKIIVVLSAWIRNHDFSRKVRGMHLLARPNRG